MTLIPGLRVSQPKLWGSEMAVLAKPCPNYRFVRKIDIIIVYFKPLSFEGFFFKLVLLWIPMYPLTLALRKIYRFSRYDPVFNNAQKYRVLENKKVSFTNVIITDIHWQVTINIIPSSKWESFPGLDL